MSDKTLQETIEQEFDNLSDEAKKWTLRLAKVTTREEYIQKALLSPSPAPPKEVPKEKPKKGSIVKKQYQSLCSRIDENKDIVSKKLPVLPEGKRLMPRSLGRSSLFGLSKKGKKRVAYTSKTQMAAYGDDEIYYLGVELDQFDADVWMTCLHLARKDDFGTRVHFTLREFLHTMGLTSGGKNMQRLSDSLDRMQAGGITAKSGISYTGSLLHEFCISEDGHTYYIVLNENMIKLFQSDVSWQDWEIRRSLKGDLTKWMYGFICTHVSTPENPTMIGLEKIRVLCRSHNESPKGFKQEFVKSTKQLSDRGLVASWNITRNNIFSFISPPKLLVTK